MNKFLFLIFWAILIIQILNFCRVDSKSSSSSSRGSSSSRASSSSRPSSPSSRPSSSSNSNSKGTSNNGGNGNGNKGGRLHRLGQTIKKHMPTIKKGAKLAAKVVPKLVSKFGSKNKQSTNGPPEQNNESYEEIEEGGIWSAAVNGTLFCDGMPASNVLVKLYDDNSGLNLDDLLATGYSDANGTFALNGTVEKDEQIAVKLNIYHDCRDYMPCQRKIQLFLPPEFVNEGEEANSTYDVGRIELSAQRAVETRDCFHR